MDEDDDDVDDDVDADSIDRHFEDADPNDLVGVDAGLAMTNWNDTSNHFDSVDSVSNR